MRCRGAKLLVIFRPSFIVLRMSEANTVQHVVMACDESGAKGYGNSDERCIGELGVFAGIMVPGELLTNAQAQFDAIAIRYKTGAGKVHIADLAPEQQGQLRKEMFDLITQLRLPCFFEAIHVAGFHTNFRRYESLIKGVQAQRRSNVRLSDRGPAPESLHVALFFGLYSKLVAFCLEREKTLVHIELRTDQVDSPIFKDFQASAKSLLDYGASISSVSGFDPVTQKVLKGTVETKEIPIEWRLPITVTHLDFRRITHLDGLVLAADVLANSLVYHYRMRTKVERFRHLNRPETVKDHPISQSLDAFENWGTFDLSDLLYPHPCNPDLIKQMPIYNRFWPHLKCLFRWLKRRC